MDPIIILAPKEEHDYIKSFIRKRGLDVVCALLVDLKETPNYERILAWSNAKLVSILDSQNMEEELARNLEEFAKKFEFRDLPRILDWVDTKELIDDTPFYDRFLKKWKRSNNNHWWDKSKFRKKGK